MVLDDAWCQQLQAVTKPILSWCVGFVRKMSQAIEQSRETIFHGYIGWHLRAIIWTLQVIIIGAILQFALGRVGTLLTFPVSALLLFRQFHLHLIHETTE